MIAHARLREREILGMNLRRLMIRFGMSQADVRKACGLNDRTVRGIYDGTAKPTSTTLAKLAVGLGVSIDELLRDIDAERAAFDRDTNKLLSLFIQERPQLFRGWSQADLDDLASRFATGGQLTEEGLERAAAIINRRREVLARVAVLMDCRPDETEAIVGALYAGVAVAAAAPI